MLIIVLHEAKVGFHLKCCQHNRRKFSVLYNIMQFNPTMLYLFAINVDST